MSQTTTDVTTCRCLIGGKWVEPQTDRHADVFNPSTGEVIARTPLCTEADVDAAVRAAARAFESWQFTPAVERARRMFRFRDLLEKHTDELARTISREHGKTYGESVGSLQRGIEMVEFAASLPTILTGQTLPNIARDVDCETIRMPLGVVAGITPFNFPAMVPLWMYPVALVCGNTFVLKPSPRVPLTAIRIAELLLEAGVPEGVFNLVHGDKTCVDAILHHPLVRAVSFVGSTPVAKYIYQTGTAQGKRVQAAGGAKNHVVVMPDADLDAAVAGLQHAAFGCAGERCMAAALTLPVGEVAEPLVEQLADAAAKMRVGRTDTGARNVDMGPLISREHRDRVVGYIERAERGEAKIRFDGRRVPVDSPGGFFVGPTVLDEVQPDSPLARDEIFGPVLGVVRVRTLEEALELGRRCEYGNGAVIYTTSGRAAREFKLRFNAGMIGVNVGVPAPMAWFPFTGQNRSFFGDLHIQGTEGMLFYTQQRMVMTRWPEPKSGVGYKPH